ncbi:MAG TPA: membrane dipeptidase [Bacteroidales bacterium]|jgi:membrane dipeptidase|nr:membrane dipeptidase [Bacteroidales bacterium]
MTNLLRIASVLFALLIITSCEQDLSKKADKIHAQIVSIDTHTDTPLNFLEPDFDIGKWNNYDSSYSRIDFPRMKAGKLDAVFMAVFVGQGERSEEGNLKANNRALEIFEALHSKINQYPEQAEIALKAKDVYQIKSKGKSTVYIGVENAYPIGNDLNNIKSFYDLGARYITLCHTSNNDICDSSTDKKGPEFNGLSTFGEEVVKEMNQLGMIIDVSHISDSAYYDVLKLSKAPIIASHSSVRAICDNPRNFDDKMLYALKENGGVIQICILSDYIKEPAPYPERDSAFQQLRIKWNNWQGLSEEEYKQASHEWRALQKKYPRELATVADAVDHIDYVVKTIGIDYVGIGTDFDGGGGLKDCKDASEMKNITIELLKRGYNQEDIKRIWGENFLRVFREVEQIASR